MLGKKFTNLSDGSIVEIKDIFEDLVILKDNSKIRSSKLFDKNHFEEFIDPQNFFSNQSLLENFAQKIKQIPDDLVNKMTDDEKRVVNESLSDSSFKPRFDEPAILQADPELEKEELMRKYGIKNSNVTNETPFLQAQKQLDKFKAILEEIQEEDEPITRIEASRELEPLEEDDFENEIQKIIKENEISVQPKQEDPIINMFKNVKRNREFKISIDISNQIPRPDFIEMMEDSYTTSIIDFLAEEFTNEILRNPNLIKDKIIKEIKSIVYPELPEKKIEPKIETKTATKPTLNKRTRVKKETLSK